MSLYAHAHAPVRIGIAGGGTDLPAWTKERVGRCISLAIEAHTHAVAITRPDGKVVASYHNRDESTSATEIANGLIRESALMHGWEHGFEVHTLSEVSSRGSGLGVSSSIAVALAACFRRLACLRDNVCADPKWHKCDSSADGTCKIDHHASCGRRVHQKDMAESAWIAEIDRLRRPVGRQDHMAAAHGGLRTYTFEGNGASVEHSFARHEADWVANHLALVQLPEGHDARGILSGVKGTEALEAAAEAVPLAMRAIEERSVEALGMALDFGHDAKKSIPGAVPRWLDEIISKLNDMNEVGGCKVAGAGGGGHIVVACEPTAHEIIAKATGLRVIAVKANHAGVWTDSCPPG